MIGVVPRPDQVAAVEEFFELFKTPWELYRPHRQYDVVIVTSGHVPDVDSKLLLIFGADTKNPGSAQAGSSRRLTEGCLDYRGWRVPIFGPVLTFDAASSAVLSLADDGPLVGVVLETTDDRRIVRIGYDLFDEVRFLLLTGQPAESADVPTLDMHIAMVRDWILRAGIPLVEIPPVPAGHRFAICLTHDIDFVGIRRHRFDHSMWGFLYRSTIGALRDLARGRISPGRLLRMWRAAASLPFVLIGWAKDFWEPFAWYLRVEENLPATYYLIPFKGLQGDRTSGRHAARRATSYDVSDLHQWPARMMRARCELGVHGIDAWHSADRAREELARVADVTGAPVTGIRIHWLLRDAGTSAVLDQAGYDYDSTLGYNETVGFRNGTTQAFRPLGVKHLLELPMHIQDGALFFPDRLDLAESEAWERCAPILEHANSAGGVLTVLWHDRSHGPERFWGDFYVRLVEHLKGSHGWFGTAAEVVGWFRKRRAVRFVPRDAADATHASLCYEGDEIDPPLTIRFQQPTFEADSTAGAPTVRTVDVPWNGKSRIDCDPHLVTIESRSGRATERYSFQ